VFLFAFLALAFGNCSTPQCNPEDGPCCALDCTFTTTMCRAARNDCDQIEYCTGASALCPADASINSFSGDLAWTFLNTTAELKVYLPICTDDETSEWVKIRFLSLTEMDSDNLSQAAWPRVDLTAQNYVTRILPLSEAALINEVFTSFNPRDLAQVSTQFTVNGRPMTLVLTVIYFSSSSQVAWTDNNGVTRTMSIPENRVKFTVQLSGAWPWVSSMNHTLALSLGVTYSNAADVRINQGTSALTIDTSSDEMNSQITFPTGTNSPLLVDGIFGMASATASQGSDLVSVMVHLPWFNSSVIYDPMVQIVDPNPPEGAAGSLVIAPLMFMLVALQRLF